MTLAGRLLEQSQFQAAHEHELQSAFAVQRLCGFDADALIPKTLKDPLRRQDSTDDLYDIDDRLHPVPARFYEQFLNGSWIDPSQLGQLPKEPGTTLSSADYTYAATDQQRLWQVWIETALPSPTLELEVSYPPDMIQRRDGRGYMFRVALTTSSNEADRKNDAFSGELKDDVLLTRRNTRWVSLHVPNY